MIDPEELRVVQETIEAFANDKAGAWRAWIPRDLVENLAQVVMRALEDYREGKTL